MRIYKVIVKSGDKEYLSVAPLLENKAKAKAQKLHEEFPIATVSILSTDNPSDGWDEVWFVDPSKEEVHVYTSEEDEDY